MCVVLCVCLVRALCHDMLCFAMLCYCWLLFIDCCVLVCVYSRCTVGLPQQVESVLEILRVSEHGHWCAGLFASKLMVTGRNRSGGLVIHSGCRSVVDSMTLDFP